MKTLDIKIQNKQKKKKAKLHLSDNKNDSTNSTLASGSSEEADSEFTFFDDTPEFSKDKFKKEEVEVLTKSHTFTDKCLARLMSLVKSE